MVDEDVVPLVLGALDQRPDDQHPQRASREQDQHADDDERRDPDGLLDPQVEVGEPALRAGLGGLADCLVERVLRLG